MTVKGLDELTRTLGDLAKRAKKLDGTRTVPLEELLTPEFVRAHTRFQDAEGLITASGFKVDSASDFKAIPDEEWNAFIRSASDFADWDSMLGAALKEWTARKLGL
jgi:hypothetical protein